MRSAETEFMVQEMLIRVENTTKFFAAEAPRGVDSPIFEARVSRLANGLERRGHVTGIQLLNKVAISTCHSLCNDRHRWLRQCSEVQQLRSSTRSSRFLSRRRDRFQWCRGLGRPYGESTVAVH